MAGGETQVVSTSFARCGLPGADSPVDQDRSQSAHNVRIVVSLCETAEAWSRLTRGTADRKGLCYSK